MLFNQEKKLTDLSFEFYLLLSTIFQHNPAWNSFVSVFMQCQWMNIYSLLWVITYYVIFIYLAIMRLQSLWSIWHPSSLDVKLCLAADNYSITLVLRSQLSKATATVRGYNIQTQSYSCFKNMLNQLLHFKFVKFIILKWQYFLNSHHLNIHRLAGTLKPLTSQVNNTDNVGTMPSSAGKLCVLEFIWMSLQQTTWLEEHNKKPTALTMQQNKFTILHQPPPHKTLRIHSTSRCQVPQ